MNDELTQLLASRPAPTGGFASDNSSGIHPQVLEAIARANVGHSLAYGDDSWSREAQDRLRDELGGDGDVLVVFGGTGANVTALHCMLEAHQSVLAADEAHLLVDEAGAPERITGAKLIGLETAAGIIEPEAIEEAVTVLGDIHASQPGVLSITQSNERGLVYTTAELEALCETAHRYGIAVHLDGARYANAVATLVDGGELGAAQASGFAAGVDVMSWGGTKNGALGAEAVVFREPNPRARWLHKQTGQLPSKMRYASAQILALLTDGLWIDNARHANNMARKLEIAIAHSEAAELAWYGQANSVFVRLDARIVEALQTWTAFHSWPDQDGGRTHHPLDGHRTLVRFVASFDTSVDDLQRLVEGIRIAGAWAANLDNNS